MRPRFSCCTAYFWFCPSHVPGFVDPWVLLDYVFLGSPGPEPIKISLSLAMVEFSVKILLCLYVEGCLKLAHSCYLTGPSCLLDEILIKAFDPLQPGVCHAHPYVCEKNFSRVFQMFQREWKQNEESKKIQIPGSDTGWCNTPYIFTILVFF